MNEAKLLGLGLAISLMQLAQASNTPIIYCFSGQEDVSPKAMEIRVYQPDNREPNAEVSGTQLAKGTPRQYDGLNITNAGVTGANFTLKFTTQAVQDTASKYKTRNATFSYSMGSLVNYIDSATGLPGELTCRTIMP